MILPDVSEEFDKNYAIILDSISAEDKKTLRESGYKEYHRPNVCLYGSIRTCWTLNPYRKTLVDAALKTMEPITFKEFIKNVYGLDL